MVAISQHVEWEATEFRRARLDQLATAILIRQSVDGIDGVREMLAVKYPGQPRDDMGRFGSGGIGNVHMAPDTGAGGSGAGGGRSREFEVNAETARRRAKKGQSAFPKEMPPYDRGKFGISRKEKDSLPVEMVPVNDIVTRQSTVNPANVQYFVNGGKAPENSFQPYVVRTPDGKNYLEDGNTRLTAMVILGATEVPVKVLKIDDNGRWVGRDGGNIKSAGNLRLKYPGQPRDDEGKFSSGGGGGIHNAATASETGSRGGRTGIHEAVTPAEPSSGNAATTSAVGNHFASTGSYHEGAAATVPEQMKGRTALTPDITDKVKSIKSLDGGTNAVRLVEYEDAEGNIKRGVFKPASGEAIGTPQEFAGRQSVCEVCASVVDEEMGLGMTAKAGIVSIHGQVGSLSEFVNDTAKLAGHVYYDSGAAKLKEADGLSDMMYYDVLIGNTDRHAANWMVKDNKVRLIDNGRSFAKNEEYAANINGARTALYFRSFEHDSKFRYEQAMTPKFKSSLEKLHANRKSVDARLKAEGLEDANRKSFWQRADHLRKLAKSGGKVGFSEVSISEVAVDSMKQGAKNG